MSEEVRKNEVFSKETQGTTPTGPGLGQDSKFQVPVETVPLPSNGRVYSANHPLYNKQTVDIRAMTTRDEDILTSRALSKNGTVISQLIRACLIDKRIDPGGMLSGDRNAVMVAIRITGYGRDYAVEVTCPDDDCEEKNIYSFDLAQLPIKRLTLEPVSDGENLFSFDLPSGHHVLWRFMTGRDEEELTQSQNAKKKIKMADEGLVTGRMQRMIVAINGERDRSKISAIIPQLPASDSRAFRKYVQQHEPGIEMIGDFVCPSCGLQSEVDVPLGASFFWP